MSTKKVWIVKHSIMIRNNQDIKNGLFGFKEKMNETEHISQDIAIQAAKNIATQFPPDNGDHDNFDNMTNVKDQKSQVIYRVIEDTVYEEFRHHEA